MADKDIRHRKLRFESDEADRNNKPRFSSTYESSIRILQDTSRIVKGFGTNRLFLIGILFLVSPSLLLIYYGTLQIRQVQPHLPSPLSFTSESSLSLSSSPNSTLALLYPPGLMGGYRNQVLRFVALVQHANEHNLTLFLPSLWWNTQITIQQQDEEAPVHRRDNASMNQSASGSQSTTTTWYPVPMELLFDVRTWNRHAAEHPGSLPRIITKVSNSDCWTEEPVARIEELEKKLIDPPLVSLHHELLKRGHLVPLSNVTLPLLSPIAATVKSDYNPRLSDFLPHVAHCQHPRVYGGGQRAGRLWNEYLKLIKQHASKSSPPAVLAHVLQALQPLPRWRQLGAEYCIGNNNAAQHAGRVPYVALHARVELEMMGHPCGAQMERNLSRILDHVGHFLDDRQNSTDLVPPTVFVAVSREGMQDKRFPKFLQLGLDNVRTLNEYVGYPASITEQPPSIQPKLLHRQYPVVECGSEMMKRYYNTSPAQKSVTGSSRSDTDHSIDLDLGTMLEQVINFDMAIQSDLFVGVEQSSYSNAVWTTRYHLGKSNSNFRYTPTGIEAIGGLPDPHANCRGRRSKDKQKT